MASELATLIKSHLADNSDIQLNPHFAGLFSSKQAALHGQ